MERVEQPRKCHNCRGSGFVTGNTYKGVCYYCQGKGYRSSHYGIDKIVRRKVKKNE